MYLKSNSEQVNTIETFSLKNINILSTGNVFDVCVAIVDITFTLQSFSCTGIVIRLAMFSHNLGLFVVCLKVSI